MHYTLTTFGVWLKSEVRENLELLYLQPWNILWCQIFKKYVLF